MRTLFDARPGLWEHNGNLAKQVEASWLRTIVGEDDALFRESVEHKLRALRAELAGPAPSPLERLLVDRILACWLQVHYVDTIFAQRLQKELHWAATDHYQAWLDRAQKRHLSAIRALAQVRRLLVPVVQVNIADKQVNVGATRVRRGTIDAEG